MLRKDAWEGIVDFLRKANNEVWFRDYGKPLDFIRWLFLYIWLIIKRELVFKESRNDSNKIQTVPMKSITHNKLLLLLLVVFNSLSGKAQQINDNYTDRALYVDNFD
jgi:hypothetical protein